MLSSPPSVDRHAGRATRALTGAIAMGVALALGWATSPMTPDAPFAPFALADRAVRLAPGDIATLAIEQLGKLGIATLTAAMVAAFLMAGALLAVALRDRKRGAALGGLAVFALFAVGPALGPGNARTTPVLVNAAVAGALFAVVLQSSRALRSAGTRPDRGRRAALNTIGVTVTGLLVGGAVLSRVLFGGGSTAGAATVRAPDELALVPPDRRPTLRVDGLSSPVTSVADHYVVDIDVVDPSVDVDDWTLAVDGLVDRPLRLTYEGLQRDFRLVEEYSVLTCVSNIVGGNLVGNSRWTGVRLADVLRRAGMRAGAVDVVFRCADGYDVSVPVRHAMEPTSLLAIAQNGRPLTREHGFPCRARVPSLYGMMNPKWIESIEVVGSDHKGYWAQRGWADVAPVRTQSRVDAPLAARLGEGTQIAGIAWAGLRGIDAVEVSLDGGRSWSRAQLEPALSSAAWTRWAYRWTPPRRGGQLVMCRAVDGTGRRQDAEARDPHPSGATGYHRFVIAVS